jgi:hypothetical protein
MTGKIRHGCKARSAGHQTSARPGRLGSQGLDQARQQPSNLQFLTVKFLAQAIRHAFL